MEIKHQPIITKAKVFLQPGNRMMFELEQFSQRGNMTRDSDQNPIDTEESTKCSKDEDKTFLRIRKIDTKEDSSFWNRLPPTTQRENIQFCFQNYIPPMITVFNKKLIINETFIFGCVVEKNGVESISKNCFKIDGRFSEEQSLYVLSKCKGKFSQPRLNPGICSFVPDSDSTNKLSEAKILILGGNNGVKLPESAENALDCLYSDCMLFDPSTDNFDSDFKLKLKEAKDCVSAICIENRYVYAFFGRTACINFDDIKNDPNNKGFKKLKHPKRYEYSCKIERCDLTSKDLSFEIREVTLNKSVHKVLNPLIIYSTSYDHKGFIILGGVKGSQIPSNQVCILKDLTKCFESKTETKPEVCLYSEESKYENKLELTIPCSFPCKDICQIDSIYYSLGFDVAGRPWVTCIDLKNLISIRQRTIIS